MLWVHLSSPHSQWSVVPVAAAFRLRPAPADREASRPHPFGCAEGRGGLPPGGARRGV